MMRPHLTLCLFLALLFCENLLAQEESQRAARLRLRDGTEISGTVLSEDKGRIIIESNSLGKLNIARSEISVLEYFQPGAYRGDWFPIRGKGHSLLSPVTGFAPGKGEGYYQNFMLFVNQGFVGITNNFSMGAGIEFFSVLAGVGDFPSIALYPKFAIPIADSKFQVGLGGVLSHLSDYGPSTFDFSCYYAALTYGTPDRHFTAGLAYAHLDGDFRPAPIYIVGGQYRLGRRFALVTENWIADPLEGSLLSFSGRLIGHKVNWDFAMMIVVDRSFSFGADIYPVPLLGITVPFR